MRRLRAQIAPLSPAWRALPPQVLTTSLLQRALIYPKAYRGVDLRQVPLFIFAHT